MPVYKSFELTLQHDEAPPEEYLLGESELEKQFYALHAIAIDKRFKRLTLILDGKPEYQIVTVTLKPSPHEIDISSN